MGNNYLAIATLPNRSGLIRELQIVSVHIRPKNVSVEYRVAAYENNNGVKGDLIEDFTYEKVHSSAGFYFDDLNNQFVFPTPDSSGQVTLPEGVTTETDYIINLSQTQIMFGKILNLLNKARQADILSLSKNG